MKKLLLIVPMLLVLLPGFSQNWSPVVGETAMKSADKVPAKAPFFSIKDVRLTDSPFKKAMDLDMAYLLELEPDRLLHRFRLHAGLPPKGEIYGGWENMGISGHSLGHYLSALALGYAASGDQRLLEKLNYTVDELAVCQDARQTGYIGAIPKEDSVFADIKKGMITSAGFDLNGLWVPWYTIHKIFAGLEDAYLYAGNQKALDIAIRFGEWANDETANLDEAKWQKMLACEHGGMNETLANLYAITGREMFLNLSKKFHHKTILDPLAAGRDELTGKHANTQIPKIIGCARRYELTGNQEDFDIANNFWQTVVKHHSYVIGGNSENEHFGSADHLSDRLSASTTETCNTNNMLKLTRHLFSLQPGAAWMDYYERALYNHILASQNPEDGMVCYFLPLQSGAQKTYSDKFNSFWCCVGTGIENHVKYGESIYALSETGGLYVNLFIPSELNWSDNGLKIKQQGDFPQSGKIEFTISGTKKKAFTLQIRYPVWATSAVVMINGRPEKIMYNPGSYFTLKHDWKDGDRIEVRFGMKLYSEPMPDKSDRRALLYGPVVLAGELCAEPVGCETPLMVADGAHPEKWMKKIGSQSLVFESKNVGYPKDIRFKPLYQTHHGQRYTVYFDFFTKAGLEKYKVEYAAEQERRKALEARTIDIIRIGEMQPERDHQLEGERTFSGGIGERKWRDARDGGWFAFTLKTDPEKVNVLQCTYWGSDSNGRIFDILADGKLVATQVLDNNDPNHFFEKEYTIPQAFTKGKSQVVIRFQAQPGKSAGGLFGARMLRTD